jgi:hypothetical protein
MPGEIDGGASSDRTALSGRGGVWRARAAAAAVAFALVVFAALGWRGNLFGIRTERPLGSVARAFDQPIAYPGNVWTRDGRRVTEFELVTIAGPEHCGWQSATVLFIAWPPGTVAPDASRSRQYVRDPQGVMLRAGQTSFERNVTLPPDAKPTGHWLGVIELYFSPTDDERWIYVVSPSGAERWPRVDPMILCA